MWNVKLICRPQGCEESVGSIEGRLQHSFPHGQAWCLYTWWGWYLMEWRFQLMFYSDHSVKTHILRWGHSCVETRTLCSRGRRSWSTRSPSWATPRRVPASSSSSTCSSSSLGPKGRRSCRSVELLGGNHTFVIAIQLIQKFSVHYWLLFSSSWWPCQPPPKVCHRDWFKSIILLGQFKYCFVAGT